MYVWIHVSKSLFDRVVKDHSCGGMISYASEWNKEVLGLVRNQVGRVVMTIIRVRYHVDMNLYCIILLLLCLLHAMWKDILVK